MIDDAYSIAEQEKVKYYLESAKLPSDIATVNAVINLSDVTGHTRLYIVTQIAEVVNDYASQSENQRATINEKAPETILSSDCTC